jgi:ribosome-associated protein
MTDNNYSQDDDRYVSKSQRKHENHAQQALSEELVHLNTEQLAQLDLPQALLDAVRMAQQIKSRSAHKRQLQFIGKLMRELDPQPIEQKMDDLKGVSRQAVALQHKTEQWRDRLLGEDQAALEELFDTYPHADRQHIRQLIRNAINERKANKPLRAFRELYQVLKELISTQV